jgi:hypothetical protein
MSALTAEVLERLLEADEDNWEIPDYKDLETPRKALALGQGVRVLYGAYKDGVGTVVGRRRTDDGWHFYVHLDGTSRHDVISYPPDWLDPEDNPAPPYRAGGFEPGQIVRVKAGRDANRLGVVVGSLDDEDAPITYVHLHDHDHPEDPDENWHISSYDPSNLELQDNPQVAEAIHRLTETDDLDDSSDMKDLNPTLDQALAADLREAGFIVEESDFKDGWLFLRFSWPAENIVAKTRGAKRAWEVLRDLHLVLGDFHYEDYQEGTRFCRLLVSKKIDETGAKWAVTPHTIGGYGHSFYQIAFYGENVGTAFIPEEELGAAALRAELNALADLVPFDADQWVAASGTSWGWGPALVWWRTNRLRLLPDQRYAEYRLNRRLLGPST